MLLLIGAAGSLHAVPKNVILMVCDGWGYNQIAATDAYSGTKAPYLSADFSSYAMKTNSASNSAGYNSTSAWVSDGLGGLKPNFDYFKSGSGATDSAAAITAFMTGVKTYDGRINWSTSGQKISTFADYAKSAGHAVGAITTVTWSHATPSGVMAHNISRSNYLELANEMVNSSMDVILGAGNPGYDDNSNTAINDSIYVGGAATWNALKNGTAGGVNPWTLVVDRSAFQALAVGATPNRVLGTIKSYTTAQQARTGNVQVVDIAGRKTVVPTLSEMSRAALNVLDNDPDGFFLMIEGGAVDYANHAKQKGRLIEELLDFNLAVNAVVDYVNTNSSWENTLLIVTGDHECGLLLGPNGQTSIVNSGVGNMPGMTYYSGSHSNQLIPLFARGAGSELFAQYALGSDLVRGKYIDNTDVFKVMTRATTEPAATSLDIIVDLGPDYKAAYSAISLKYLLVGPKQYSGSLTLNNLKRATIEGIIPGTYQLSLYGSHWLRRTVVGISVDGVNSLITTLSSGDADGDNSVNLFDYAVLDSFFGSSHPMGDLNGDGQVNLFDYIAIDRNFGARGD